MGTNCRCTLAPLNLVEDRQPTPDVGIQLVESSPLSEAATADGAPGTRRFRARLIEGDVWGSSGYYSRTLLESAVTAGVFAEGTPIYIDHPTMTDRAERPERSVRDLAGRLTGTAIYEADGVYSDIEVYSHFAPVLTEMWEDIGMSIRASGDVEYGEAAGRNGPLVSEISRVASVDFVTEAGAGGRVVSLIESARVNDRAVREHGLEEATVNDRREALSALVRDTYAADRTYVWLRDFDDATAWFDIEAGDESGTWQQTYSTGDDDLANALTGDRVEVRATTTYVPVVPAGQSIEESQEDTMQQIEEARLRQLEEAAGREEAATARADAAEARAQESDRRVALAEARTTARQRATQRVTEANGDLPDATVNRIVESAVAGMTLTDDNQLDEAALDTAVDAARTTEETYIASLQESTGAGKVIGFGKKELAEATSEDADNARAAAFGRKKEA